MTLIDTINHNYDNKDLENIPLEIHSLPIELENDGSQTNRSATITQSSINRDNNNLLNTITSNSVSSMESIDKYKFKDNNDFKYSEEDIEKNNIEDLKEILYKINNHIDNNELKAANLLSYNFNNNQYALAIDAAAPVSSFREDLIKR